jgi:hypothetical protein
MSVRYKMKERFSNRIGFYITLFIFIVSTSLWPNTRSTFSTVLLPPNLIITLTIEHTDPNTGKKVIFKADSARGPKSKSIRVPAGAELVLKFSVDNTGGPPGGDGVSLDVWYDWPKRTKPGDNDQSDDGCLPEGPWDCFRMTKTLKADLFYKGKMGKGIYNIAVWVDRFNFVSELDETDNFLGPIKITVLPELKRKKAPLTLKPQIPPALRSLGED